MWDLPEAHQLVGRKRRDPPLGGPRTQSPKRLGGYPHSIGETRRKLKYGSELEGATTPDASPTDHSCHTVPLLSVACVTTTPPERRNHEAPRRGVDPQRVGPHGLRRVRTPHEPRAVGGARRT